MGAYNPKVRTIDQPLVSLQFIYFEILNSTVVMNITNQPLNIIIR